MDHRWEQLTLGQLSPAEADDLLSGDDASELAPLFTPLDDGFNNAVLDEILEEAAAQSSAKTEVVVPPSIQPAPPVASAANRAIRWALPLLAIAAAVLVYFAVPAPTAVYPDYSVQIEGGDQQIRGTPTEAQTIELSAGSRAQVLLRPASPVENAQSTVYVRRGGQLHLWPQAKTQVSEQGAVRLSLVHGMQGLNEEVTAVIVVVHPAKASGVQGSAEGDGPWPSHTVPLSVQAAQ